MRQKNKIIFLLINIDFRTFKYKKYCFKLGREIQRKTFKMTNIYLLRNPKAKEKQKIPLHLSHFFGKVQHLVQFFEPKNVVYKIYKKRKRQMLQTFFQQAYQHIFQKQNSNLSPENSIRAFLEAWFNNHSVIFYIFDGSQRRVRSGRPIFPLFSPIWKLVSGKISPRVVGSCWLGRVGRDSWILLPSS